MREGLFKGPGRRVAELEDEVARLRLVMNHQGEQLQHANELAHAAIGRISTWGNDAGASQVRRAFASIADATR